MVLSREDILAFFSWKECLEKCEEKRKSIIRPFIAMNLVV